MDNPMKQALLEAFANDQAEKIATAQSTSLFPVERGMPSRMRQQRRTTSGATTRVWRAVLNSRETTLFFHSDPQVRQAFRNHFIHVLANEMTLNRCDRCELSDTLGNPIAEYVLPC